MARNSLPGGFQSFWQGNSPWLPGLFIYMLGLRIAISAVPDDFTTPIFLVASLSVLIWQVVGGVRMANRTLSENGDVFRPLAIYAGVLAVVVLSVVQAIDVASGYYRVEPQSYRTNVPRLHVEGSDIIVKGEIDFAMNTALKNAVAANPDAQSVLLESQGGSIFAGRGMAITIARNNLNTKVTNRCYSACTIAFVAGRFRTLAPGGELGFHGYSFDNAMRVQTVDVRAQEREDQEFFQQRGISRAFLDRVFQTAPNNLWVPTRAELIAAGVISE